ncbi:MAG TPA: hypothetical protein PKI03_01125 [Pseudomonadota bacterium]|nr:hypothetical protein [Pseudomonadota bacterium]
MSSDLKEIFDLARLRRAWGDKNAGPPAGPSSNSDEGSPVVAEPEPPPPRRPLQILDGLCDAVRSEFPTHASALAYHLDILRHRLSALLGEPEPGGGSTAAAGKKSELPTELAVAYHVDVQEQLDQLEDLIDALSLPSGSGE